MDRRNFLLTAGLTWLGSNGVAWAQDVPSLSSIAPAPHPYAITPAAGKWMVLINSYMGPKAPMMAEEFCTVLRRDYRLPAYLYNRGGEEREREKARIAALRAQQEAFFKQLNTEVVPGRIRTVRIEEQYAVLVGGFPDMEAARKALDQIRKLPPPKQTHLLDSTMIATNADEKTKGEVLQTAYLNPFLSGFVVPNPTAPKDVDPDAGKPDPILKDLNRGERYSVLNCKKEWTMVVKVYHAPAVVQSRGTSGDFVKKLFGGKSNETLNAIAKQAVSLAEFLRGFKPQGYEAYVLHTAYSSIVCVGQYDSPQDAQFAQTAKTLGGMKLGSIDQLMINPLPMRVPRFE
ncbi:SPOR domain-containing protein [Tuwongella immobilis]|uniref:Hypothetical conserved protein n=1 Tax=Tuwongella immobilis TaxID=692036 RepID=A0A6C2YRR8_9BACT|nr:SPOR domain-containing protein [Tuwongella immobilis]VIP04051.1 Hypothetical conserved protein OS=uncultured planctomycete GN=HGMM_F09D09C09 PE=4 SV=1 [Tuwongella immobilis]VTS05469.1 Hypothetical conserved protein OS=uncultured planctomycete GN=HGMM_F09D09C09 PE=4 SV=1 [Tuwongella immobilis]